MADRMGQDAMMQSAEEERMQQAQIVEEEGADFAAALSEPAPPAKSTSADHAGSGGHRHLASAPVVPGHMQPPSFHASQMPGRQPVGVALPAKSAAAASPSACSSPLNTQHGPA